MPTTAAPTTTTTQTFFSGTNSNSLPGQHTSYDTPRRQYRHQDRPPTRSSRVRSCARSNCPPPAPPAAATSPHRRPQAPRAASACGRPRPGPRPRARRSSHRMGDSHADHGANLGGGPRSMGGRRAGPWQGQGAPDPPAAPATVSSLMKDWPGEPMAPDDRYGKTSSSMVMNKGARYKVYELIRTYVRLVRCYWLPSPPKACISTTPPSPCARKVSGATRPAMGIPTHPHATPTALSGRASPVVLPDSTRSTHSHARDRPPHQHCPSPASNGTDPEAVYRQIYVTAQQQHAAALSVGACRLELWLSSSHFLAVRAMLGCAPL